MNARDNVMLDVIRSHFGLSSERMFAFDESISHAQEDKIIALETRLAPRKLSDTGKMTEKLNAFSGTPFSIGIQPGDETLSLLDQVVPVLRGAGWQWQDAPPMAGDQVLNSPGNPKMAVIVLRGGVEIRYPKSGPQTLKEAASALATELTAEGLTNLVLPWDGITLIEVNIGTKPP